MTEYNTRQCALMRGKIAAFQNQSLSLRNLIADLDGLLSALEEPNREWKDSVQKQWGRLEDVYATVKSRGDTQLDAQELELVKNAVATISTLITESQ